MKRFGIASPRLALNTLPFLFVFVFLEITMLFIGFNSELLFFHLLPLCFFVLFIIVLIKDRKALAPYRMNETGIRNHKISIPWQDIANVALLHTEVPSRFVRGHTIQRFSICIGNIQYGDLFHQFSEQSITLPLTQKSLALLRELGGGKSAVLDEFLAEQE